MVNNRLKMDLRDWILYGDAPPSARSSYVEALDLLFYSLLLIGTLLYYNEYGYISVPVFLVAGYIKLLLLLSLYRSGKVKRNAGEF